MAWIQAGFGRSIRIEARKGAQAINPTDTPLRHARTCSGHPRLAASRCEPGADVPVETRGYPEQVRARRYGRSETGGKSKPDSNATSAAMTCWGCGADGQKLLERVTNAIRHRGRPVDALTSGQSHDDRDTVLSTRLPWSSPPRKRGSRRLWIHAPHSPLPAFAGTSFAGTSSAGTSSAGMTGRRAAGLSLRAWGLERSGTIVSRSRESGYGFAPPDRLRCRL